MEFEADAGEPEEPMLEPDDSPDATKEAGLTGKGEWHPDRPSEEQEAEHFDEVHVPDPDPLDDDANPIAEWHDPGED